MILWQDLLLIDFKNKHKIIPLPSPSPLTSNKEHVMISRRRNLCHQLISGKLDASATNL
jgi:hypothetical protein